MIKTLKILGIFALVAAIVFSMAACKQDDDPNQPKQYLKVEGLSTYNNKYGIIVLSPSISSDYTIYSALEKIKTSTSFPLYIRENNDPWEGSGNFSVKLLIFNNAAEDSMIFKGVTTEMYITGNTVIPLSSFTPK